MAQPSPSASGTSTPNPSVNLDVLDFGHPASHYPRPFKTPPAKARNPRRNKNLKQILQDEQKALAAAAAAEAADTPNASNGTKASVRGRSGKTFRAEGLQWSDIDAPPSLLPQKKYCDITGLEGKYTDPKSKLRYHNAEVYAVIQTLPASTDQQVLLEICVC
jgi:INO80 complex subunit C